MARVLIIEDDPLMVRLYGKVLKFEGYEVSTALSGKEGLEKANSDKPSLILLDIMMPEMSGLEVLERLKKDPGTKEIPVVVLSNLAGTQDAETALAKGAIKYIVKSEHEPKEIAQIVKEVLGSLTTGDVPKTQPLPKEDSSEFRDLFLKTARENINLLNESLTKLKEDPTDKDAQENAFRSAHSLKGENKAMGYSSSGYLSNVIEDVMRGISEGKMSLNPDLINLLFASAKYLADSLDNVEKQSKELNVSSQAEKLKAATKVETSPTS